jgi:hypothetical protein
VERLEIRRWAAARSDPTVAALDDFSRHLPVEMVEQPMAVGVLGVV